MKQFKSVSPNPVINEFKWGSTEPSPSKSCSSPPWATARFRSRSTRPSADKHRRIRVLRSLFSLEPQASSGGASSSGASLLLAPRLRARRLVFIRRPHRLLRSPYAARMHRSYNLFRLQFFQRRFHNIDPLNGLRIRCSRAPCAALRCARLSGSCRRRAGGLRLMAGRTRLSRVTRLASRGGRSGRMFRSGARSALHRSPLLRDAARGARARVPDCVLRLPSSRPPQVPVPPTRASSSAGTLRLRKPEASGPAPARLPDGQPSVRVTQASFFGEHTKAETDRKPDGAHDGLLAHARPLHGRTDAARGVLRRERNPSAHQAASGRRPRRLQQGLGLCSRARHRAPLGLRGPSVLVGRRMAHLGRRRFGPRLRGRGPSVHLRRPSRGGLVARSRTAVWKGRSAVAAVVVYLVLSHAAMVFGMFDPVQFGWRASDDMHMTHGAHAMPETHAGHVIH